MAAKYHVRIDNRLLHGQVVQFWIPFLKIERLIIADDTVYSGPNMAQIYRRAVSKSVHLEVCSVSQILSFCNRQAEVSTLFIFSDVCDLARAYQCGFTFPCVTLGNVHAVLGRHRITDSVHLSVEEIAALFYLRKEGVRVEIQTFPGDALALEIGADGGPKWLKQ